jgi:hypothetical protein
VPQGFYASGAPDVLENFDEFVLVNGIFAPDLPAGVVIDGIGILGIPVAQGEGVPQTKNPFVDSVGTGGGFGGGSLTVRPGSNTSITHIGAGFLGLGLANLPTAVGIVWTDGPPPPSNGSAPTYTFEFFGLDSFFNSISLA